jgi:hypothetical protein
MDGGWFELFLLLMAGLIALVSRMVQASKQIRSRSAAEQKRKEERRSVEFTTREPEGSIEETLVPAPPLPAPPPPLPPQVRARPPPPPPKPQAVRRPTRRKSARPRRRQLAPRLERPATRQEAAQRIERSLPPRLQSLHLALLGNPEKLREAFLMREVLGPPKALRRRWRY